MAAQRDDRREREHADGEEPAGQQLRPAEGRPGAGMLQILEVCSAGTSRAIRWAAWV
jgi:hypothetical protein